MKVKRQTFIGEQKKGRKHTNNLGRRQIQRGKTTDQVKRMARRLGIPYASPQTKDETR